MTLRDRIVEEALSWENTPYHTHGRVKGVGVDCAMLPACVYQAVGITPEINPRYTPDWMMHRDEELYLSYIVPHAREITREEVRPGDLVIWKFGRTFSHSAIVIDPPVVLHAVIRGNCVMRANMDEETELVVRPKKFFTVVDE